MDDAVADAATSYDLYLRLPERGTFWGLKDHGVTLGADRIVYVVDGEEAARPYSEIAEVHLQSGAVGENTVASCKLTFNDGSQVSVLSCNSSGLEDANRERDALYEAFVRGLHQRLGRLQGASIAFTAGFGEARYRLLKALYWISIAFFILLPTVLILLTGQFGKFWLIYCALLLVLPLRSLVKTDTPRSYDPSDPPRFLQSQSPLRQMLSSFQGR